MAPSPNTLLLSLFMCCTVSPRALVFLLLLCGGALSSAASFAPAMTSRGLNNKARLQPRNLRLYSHDDNNKNVEVSHSSDGLLLPSRRQALVSVAGALVALTQASRTDAAVTDETNAFANTAFDSSYRGLKSDRPPMSGTSQSTAIPSDEVLISVPKSELSKGLGIELSQIDFRTNIRVYIKSVEPGSVAAKLGIKKDFIVVSVNGKSAERTNAEGVAILVSQAVKAKPADGTVDFVFRDASAFNEKLADLTPASGQVTTQVAPAGDTTQRNQDGSIKAGRVETQQTDQRLTVTQLVAPRMCNRQATTDDLLEISYVGTVVDTGEIFDGSAIKINGEGIPGRGNDVSLYFVLKKQPFGQFPPGFDVGLEGMCVVSLSCCCVVSCVLLV